MDGDGGKRLEDSKIERIHTGTVYWDRDRQLNGSSANTSINTIVNLFDALFS